MKKIKVFLDVLIFTILLNSSTILAQNTQSEIGTDTARTRTETDNTRTLDSQGESRTNYGQWGLLGLLGLLGLIGSGRKKNVTTYRSTL